MPNPPLAVIFDLFYTLIDMRGVSIATSTSEMLGIDSDLWSRTVMEASPHHALGVDADPVESVRKIAHAIDPAIPIERIRAAAVVRPSRSRQALTRVDPEPLALLARLRVAGLRLGLISNAGLDEIDGWDDSPLAPLFDSALFSCHEKLMKPEAAIYLRAAQQLGVPPERCLYVGDGGSREHEGANAVGMRTVLFLGLLKLTYPDTAATRPRIAHWTAESFAELGELVERLQADGLDG
jgi:putative hydrolase of the HAD superfamily